MFLLLISDKVSGRRESVFFRRYADALISSPENWFRLRDCDALCRFVMAAALACNDVGDKWPSEEEHRVLSEIGVTMYDSVAYYKHRAEGEVSTTFSYAPPALRPEPYQNSRQVLWALDAKRGNDLAWRTLTNLLRTFGGPTHMMMRRYRYVDEGLTGWSAPGAASARRRWNAARRLPA